MGNARRGCLSRQSLHAVRNRGYIVGVYLQARLCVQRGKVSANGYHTAYVIHIANFSTGIEALQHGSSCYDEFVGLLAQLVRALP